MIKYFFIEKDFLKKLFKIAIPVSIQSLIISSLNIIDSVMVGQLGEIQIASVGIGNRIYFILMFMMFGLCGGISVYTSQYWGKRDTKKALSTLGFMLFSGLIIVLPFSAVSFLIPEKEVFLFSNDENVLSLASTYLRITSLSFIFTLISFSISTFMRSCEQTRLPMIISSFSVLLNTLLNYILIFGNFGFPALNVAGAAYATLAARITEAILFTIIIFKLGYIDKLKNLFKFTNNDSIKWLIVALPVVFNETIWVIGDAAFSAIYGHMGTQALTAMTITYPIQQISMGLLSGLSTAAAVILGNSIGSNSASEKEIYKQSATILFISVSISLLWGLVIIAFSGIYTSLYNSPHAVIETATRILFIFAIIMFIKGSNMIIGQGVLRSGGDTKFPMYLDIIGMWLIGIPIALFSAFALQLSLIYVYTFIALDEVFRLTAGLFRVRKKIWIKNLVTDHSEAE